VSSSDPQASGRRGALASWARTPNRKKRTAPARAKSPASLDFHLARLDPTLFADASEADRIAAATAARTLYFSTIARRRWQP
jgi:hypothetical protein